MYSAKLTRPLISSIFCILELTRFSVTSVSVGLSSRKLYHGIILPKPSQVIYIRWKSFTAANMNSQIFTLMSSHTSYKLFDFVLLEFFNTFAGHRNWYVPKIIIRTLQSWWAREYVLRGLSSMSLNNYVVLKISRLFSKKLHIRSVGRGIIRCLSTVSLRTWSHLKFIVG